MQARVRYPANISMCCVSDFKVFILMSDSKCYYVPDRINTAYSDRMAATGLMDAARRAEGRLAKRDTLTAIAAATM
jgi:hypothetical protein